MSLFELFNEIRNDNVGNFKQILSENPSLINEYLYGVTPLLYSIECNSPNIAMDLCLCGQADMDLKDNVENSCLEKAIENKMYKIVEIVCKNSNFDKKMMLDNKETLLTNTLKMNDQNVSIALINGGFDVNLPNKLQEYPIQLAIKFNKLEVIKSMFKLNKVYIGTLKTGYNPLLDATEKDLTELALLIIDYAGSNIDVLNACDEEQQWTPLMHAITNNNDVVVKKLIDHHCEINNVDIDGNTPLHLAIINEHEYLIKVLVKSCPSLTIRNKEGKNAKQLAKLVDEDLSLLI